ncbi:ABC transporter ATP-binding protein [Rhizobium wenxiniae]|jgi:ABC-type sugar transport system ATPase subunit|uniref:ABC-type sugar transport system ATPase subunit n=1 Tax=Rhizobium wenxiniae TaxID=1737357 RepID=A0A7W9Y7J4_9HYPH|nr:sn-glycerol-3-phosphate ABC transporter ATP-binding protein UgpC [Rhizobium wenxiniae]MBB6163442.1 ABC-type sugar transport system ATPase subunit [Rhizobium wenxiniae]GGG08655.1 ABC transporter ATP-binding protein [Rhizobium wenxiniae]
MASVNLEKIVKTYPNGFEAVHGVDLEVRDGEFMVFVGPSGCSKSTILRMIAGLESISGGELKIGNTVVNNLRAKERGIAMVFQNYALYPHMKVYDNMAFGLKLAGLPKQEIHERVTQAAKMLEMEHLLDRLPRQLSGGQAQRVAVGRCIVKRPEVFLFDEPLSNLDAKLRASMRVRLTELHRELRDRGQPSTAIYVTHDQVEAMTMGERICVLKDGTIQQVDTPTTLYDRPVNAFVAGFIGSPEMNIRPATVVARDGGLGVEIGDTMLPLPAAYSDALRNLIGQKVQFGIRPEHIGTPRSILAAGSQERAAIANCTFRLREHMGNEVYTYFDLGGHEFAARIPTDFAGEIDKAERGQTIPLGFVMDKAHIFDADSGLNLTLSALPPA